MIWREGYDLLWKAIILKVRRRKRIIAASSIIYLLQPAGRVFFFFKRVTLYRTIHTTEASRHHEWNTAALVSESLTGGSRSGSGGISYRRGNTWQGKVHVIQWSFLEFFSCFYAHTNSHIWEEANDDWLCVYAR